MSTLLSQISILPVSEKLELLNAIWEDIEADIPALRKAQTEELDRRIATYERNPSDVLSWEQVKAGLFAK